ncbi:hypothetical protein H920_19779 [Fukomys damarensis]|uniref:Uncharacterized protein n=1 Tax=Fukomys damarensis TaxID=885580 RepID=A0A091CNX7_FUKDA|nr:hypothetical protein H920_19779 [Fukomys damarensis]
MCFRTPAEPLLTSGGSCCSALASFGYQQTPAGPVPPESRRARSREMFLRGSAGSGRSAFFSVYLQMGLLVHRLFLGLLGDSEENSFITRFGFCTEEVKSLVFCSGMKAKFYSILHNYSSPPPAECLTSSHKA